MFLEIGELPPSGGTQVYDTVVKIPSGLDMKSCKSALSYNPALSRKSRKELHSRKYAQYDESYDAGDEVATGVGEEGLLHGKSVELLNLPEGAICRKADAQTAGRCCSNSARCMKTTSKRWKTAIPV